MLGDALTPAARAWIRYSPVAAGKPWLWETFHWRPRAFKCRTRFGDRITGNTEDLIQRHLYYFGTWEPNISGWISATLRPGDCFVDIGANIGHYSLLASGLVGASGRVVAVEAAQWIHAILERHVALNRRSNIRTVQVAAAAARGVLKLYPGDPGNIGKTTTVERPQAGRDRDPVEVQALPLAEILTDEEIDKARIIKVDVEGAELQVLRGLAPLLGRMRADLEIAMEISPSLMPDADAAREEIFAVMKANGFSAFVFDNDYGVETYLRRGDSRRPVSLSDMRIASQADILFSRRSY
jgi:FkbM family methyltransferase